MKKISKKNTTKGKKLTVVPIKKTQLVPKQIEFNELIVGIILTFCENLAELGCPREEEPDMWFRYLSLEEQLKIADKMLDIAERYKEG